MPRGDKPTTTAFALKDGWIYEDTLPATLTEEQYDWWFKESLVLDGVRMGPPLADQPPDRAWVKLLSNGELSAYRTDIRTEHRDGRPVYEFSRVSTPVAAPVVDELAYDTRAPVDSQGAGDDAAKERDQWKEFAEECKEGIRASHRILDELNVPREDAWLQETDGESYGIEEVVEYPVHERIKMLPPLAATQMRTACVERLGQVDRAHILSNNQDYERGFRDAIRSAQTALSSLTLDQVKQKEQSK